MAVAVRQASVPATPEPISDVLATIPTWWARRAAAAELPAEWRDWRLALTAPPAPLSGAPLEELYDANPVELGEAYVAASDPTTRLDEGRHYTPSALAAALWHELTEAGCSGGTVVDPACGTGVLLLEPLRQLVASSGDPRSILEAAPHLISGTDLDPIAVWLGNALLAAELLPAWAQMSDGERRPLPRLLQVADGLFANGLAPQTVVMNPPYGRVRLDGLARSRWLDSLFGHSNRYALFLHSAIDRVAAGGLVAALVPTSFLGGAYYQRLRAFVADRAPLVRLTFVDARAGVFAGNVLQETCLAVFEKGAKPSGVTCSQIRVNGAARRVRLPAAPSPSRQSTGPWLLPRRADDGPIISVAAHLEAGLRDYGWKASTGPLVWNRHKLQIFPTDDGGRHPILWAGDLDGGAIRRSPVREQQRWIALRAEDEFMKLAEPAVLVQRTTAPEQARRLVVARLTRETLADWGGEVVVENHVNVLRSSNPSSPLTAELLDRLLQTPTFDRLYRCLTGTVAVSVYELEALRFPLSETLTYWSELAPEDLIRAVASYYRDGSA